jgi:hypothetical protein
MNAEQALSLYQSTTSNPTSSPINKPTLKWRDASVPVEIPPTPPSFVEGLIYHGVHHQLVGKPKTGKSTFIGDAVDAVRHGRPFLGRKTTPTTVLWISEQPAASLVPQLINSGLLALDQQMELDLDGTPKLLYLTIEDYYGMSYPQLVELASEKAREVKAGLVHWDTFAKIAEVKNENDASEMGAAASLLNTFTAHGIATMLTTHGGKMSEERAIQDAGRGTNAMAGHVDTILRLSPGEHPSYRKLEGKGRLPMPLEPLVINRATQDCTSRYQLVGSEARVRTRGLEEVIMQTWEQPGMKETWVARDQIVSLTGKNRKWVTSVLAQLHLVDKKLDSRGEGKKGSPIEYRASASYFAEKKAAEQGFDGGPTANWFEPGKVA